MLEECFVDEGLLFYQVFTNEVFTGGEKFTAVLIDARAKRDCVIEIGEGFKDGPDAGPCSSNDLADIAVLKKLNHEVPTW